MKMTLKMDKKRKIALALVALAVATFLAFWFGGITLALNSTKSMPRGLYLVRPAGQVQTGDIVALCIPDKWAAQVYLERHYLPASSRCASGVAPVLKPIAAAPGDDVRLDAQGLWVNGRLLDNSRVFDTDSQGLPIQHLMIGWSKKLEAGEFFMLANHIERSLDSRYYGTVQRADIHGAAVPLITF